MDKNTIIGIALILLIFLGFSLFNTSRLNKGYEKAVEKAKTEISAGNLEMARSEYINALRFKPNDPNALQEISKLDLQLGITREEPKTDSLPQAEGNVAPKALPESAALTDTGSYGPFAGAARGVNDMIVLENNKIKLEISKKGGRVYSALIKDYVTHDSRPLILFSGDSTVFGFNFYTVDNMVIRTNNLFFEPVNEENHIVVTDSQQSLIMRLYASAERYIEYKYTLAPDKYSLDYDVTFKNMEGILPSNQTYISLDWKMYIPQQEKGRDNENNYTTIKYKYFEDEVDGLRLRSQKETDQEDIASKLSWVAFQDQFFSSVVMTDKFFQSGSVTSTRLVTSPKYLRYFTSELYVPYTSGNESQVKLRLYYGPNHISTLRKEGMQLEKLVFLGKNIIGWISRFIIIPVFNWLERYISSYGLIILILTILIKIVLFPLTYKSYQSTAKMAILKPMVDEIGKKYPKQEDAMKKQQATMDLYKRAGINPMGGCLPMLLQFPILFAMFRFFPVSIELRQEHFLWATDLSTYDAIVSWSANIPLLSNFYGNHISLFTLLMTASSILTMKMSGTSPGSDQPGMKVMMWMMPIMFLFVMNRFSAGLTYYYFLANMLTWVQNVVMKRYINADKVLETLEANKKKPLPKSKWQQRLEAAAKQRGINPPKR